MKTLLLYCAALVALLILVFTDHDQEKKMKSWRELELTRGLGNIRKMIAEMDRPADTEMITGILSDVYREAGRVLEAGNGYIPDDISAPK